MGKYLIIADDFTGANDTGLQLKRRGVDIEVLFDLSKFTNFKKSYVLDTESRNIKEEEAYIKLKEKLGHIFKNKFEVVYKKIDSTLRGNIVSELIAINEEYNPEVIIFAPAFPDIKRTTINQIHMLDNIRIKETEFAKDLYKPVKEDNIYKLIKKGFDENVIHYGLDEIRNDNMDFTQSYVYTFDIENNEDLKQVVLRGIISGKKVLWVGSAGMIDAICEIKRSFLPSLGIVGSTSDVSRSQLKYAESKGTHILKIDVKKFKDKKQLYIKEAVEILNKREDLIITTIYDKEDYYKSIKVGEEKGIAKDEVGRYVQSIISELAEVVIDKAKVSGMFITGGDTAIGFINRIKALGSIIVEEVEIGIPLMRIKGGNFDGLKMITKAGAFGEEKDIFLAMRKLKEES